MEHASKTDEGTYTCLAKNEAGHKKAIAGVQVKGKLFLLFDFDLCMAVVRFTCELKCVSHCCSFNLSLLT